MKTISQIQKITGVSARTLRYYDQIGLLKPSHTSDAGYRLYSDDDLDRLQQILLYRELQFPLKEIRRIMNAPEYDRSRALGAQVEMLTAKKQHLDNLITFARGIQLLGVRYLDFSAFDTKKLDQYCQQAKQNWGKTEAWHEFEQKQQHKTREDDLRDGAEMMQIFAEFGALRNTNADSDAVQALVEALRSFITKNFYTCTIPIFSGLGRMYSCGGEISENIDRTGGPGTAAFAGEAVRIYCEHAKNQSE